MINILQQKLEASEVLISPSGEELKDYWPVPLRNLTVGQAIPFNVYLKIKKQGEMKPQFVKGVSQGEIFEKEWYRKLIQLKIPNVYVATADMGEMLQYIHRHLKRMLADDTQSELEKGMRVCDGTLVWILNFFSSKEACTREQVKIGLQFLEPLYEVIKGENHNIAHLMKTRRPKSLRLYTHCLNVSLLGMAFTSHLGWSPEKVLGFGLGALIHDIGLIRAPRAILEKRGTLTKDEMYEIKRHPIDGFRMVQGFVNLRWEALQMVLQHHENGDGTGYPEGVKLPTIHNWARILRILDSYEAMTAKRPWREAMEPKDALWTMHNDWKRSKVFDQSYLTSFFKFLAGK
jgi:HD-GYP domain-containing protein (c-di-GMP phosphodiesterase class II)